MDIRSSILLLQTSILAILFTLAMVAFYTLNLATDADVGADAGAVEVSVQAPAPPPAFKLGKTTWNANGCGSCHNKTMKDNSTGPALGGVTARWNDYPREDLYAWIRNSQKLVADGHPRAVEVSNKYPGVMSNFTSLTDEEIDGLLAYIEVQYEDY